MDVSTQKAQVLYDSLQDSVVLVDETGRIVGLNERVEEVTGYDADDLAGEDVGRLAEFARGDSFQAFEAELASVLDGTRSEGRVVVPVTSPNLGERVVDARMTPTEDVEDIAAVVVLRDVTESKQREDALAKRSEQLAIINRVLRHDIRNDVTVILGWGEHLADSLEGVEKQESARRIVDHTRHIVDLTVEAKDLIEAVETGWEMDLGAVDAITVLEREIAAVREQYPEARIEMECCDGPVTVSANEYLGSVFGNLLRNAVVHNDREEPTVTVTAETGDGSLRVRIADDGPGIPPEQQETLFEKGEKGLESPGSGIGLYLVDSLARAYGGSVDVADNEPRGSVVTVTLPLA